MATPSQQASSGSTSTTLGLMGHTVTSGQATTLPHGFAAGTLHDRTSGAWNIDTVAGKVPYFLTLVALLGTQAIAMKMALGALGKIPTIRLPLYCPHIVDLGNILPFEGLLLVTMVVFG
nr:hypothetical protein [Tanacetum cinerariifolium]